MKIKNIEELNKSKLPIVKIDKSPGESKDKVFFKEKVEKAKRNIEESWYAEDFAKVESLISC